MSAYQNNEIMVPACATEYSVPARIVGIGCEERNTRGSNFAFC